MKLILGKKFDEQPEIKDQNPVSKLADDDILKPALERAAIADTVRESATEEMPLRPVIDRDLGSISKLTVDRAAIADMADMVKEVPIVRQPVLTTDKLVINETMQAEKTAGIMPDEILPARRQFLYEAVEMREQNGKHYVANDGTATAIFQNQAAHYVDPSDNKLKDIDNSLQDIGDVLEAKANDFNVRFNKTPIKGEVFELTKKGYTVSLISGEAAAVKGGLKLENNKNEVILKNVKADTDIQYIVESDRVKENIIINKKADSYEFSFDLNIENMTAAMSEDGKTLQLKSKETNEVIFFVPVPGMTDANGEYSDRVYYEIEDKNKNTLNLKVFADTAWINSQNIVLPVIISPQIISADESLYSYQNYQQVYIPGKISGAVYIQPTSTVILVDSPYLLVGGDGYKSTLTIKKGLMTSVADRKVSKVTLKVRAYSGAGYCLIDGISTYLSPGVYSSVDITDKFTAASGNCDINFVSRNLDLVSDSVLAPVDTNSGLINGLKLQDLINRYPNLADLIIKDPRLPDLIIKNPRLPDLIIKNPRLPDLIIKNPRLPDLIIDNPGLPDLIIDNPSLPDLIINNPSLPDLIISNPSLPELIINNPSLPGLIINTSNLPNLINNNPELGGLNNNFAPINNSPSPSLLRSTSSVLTNNFDLINNDGLIKIYVNGLYSPILEVEYLTSDDSVPAKENFSLAGGVNGTLNLTSGEFVTGFTDASTKSSALACQISHVYKKNSTNYGCGKNWRLNLHQTLVKNTVANAGVDYIYTDSDGEKHGFIETYYYLNAANNKVTVAKSAVTVELDGSLWYKSGSTSYEVFKDQRTATGMSLSTKMEGFKNAENLEQRQNERKQAEEYFEACKNNLKENVVMNISGGTIYRELKNSFTGDTLSAANFNTFVSDGSASGRMVLNKGEAMQYSSLLLQKKQIEEQIDSMNKQKTTLTHNITSLDHNITSLGNNITSLGNNITSLNHNISSMGNSIYSLGNSITSLDHNITSINNNIESLSTQIEVLVCQGNSLRMQKELNKFEGSSDQKTSQYRNTYNQVNWVGTKNSSQTYVDALYANLVGSNGGWSPYIRTQIKCLEIQKNDLTTQKSDLTTQRNDLTTQRNDLTTQKNDLTTQKNDLTTQKNDLTTQKNDIDKSISSSNSQKAAAEEQINYIKNKASDNLKELKRIFKEYANKEFELKKLREQTPVSYLSDGSSSLCFNEDGNLCAISDNYNNYISVEYDTKGRISKVHEGKRATALKYNFYGQLVSVSDYRGRRTTYAYSSTSASGNLTKVTYSDGHTLEFTYSGENVSAIAASADKTKTLLAYSSNKLSKITNQSAVSAITDNALTVAASVVSITEISYCDNECAITTDGKLKHYFIDTLGNLVGGYAKLTDGSDEEKLSFSYFDRTNNWCYLVKETDDPVSLSQGLQIVRASGENKTFASPRELSAFLSAENAQTSTPVKVLQSSALAANLQKDYTIYAFDKNLLTSTTVNVASLPAGKTEFVFSAYAAASNAPATDMRFGTSFRALPSGGSSARFEIVAEVNYKDKPVQTFVASFDYKNKGKQFCALPVTLDKSLLADLQSIVLKHVYTGTGTAAFTDFRFAPCEWEYKTFDQFKNVSYSENNTVLKNHASSSNVYEKSFVNYSYDNEHRLILKRLTNTTAVGSNATVTYAVSKQFYNDYGSIARTENYVEGEEGTSGIVVEETVYNEKGNAIKKMSYNTLDSASKSYLENEYSENGQLKSEIDKTGENSTIIEYAPGTDDVQTITNPDGGKFSYGRDYVTGTVTGITQSTEDGEPNSIETKYTCGVITKLKSGLNTVNYEYDAKRRKTKVLLNGQERVKYEYEENKPSAAVTVNDIEFKEVIADNTKAILKGGASPDIITEAITDKRGNLVSTVIDGQVQFINNYNSYNSPVNSADNITGSTLTTTYDDANKRAIKSSRSAGTKEGYEDLAAVTESYAYNERGELSERAISIDGTVVQTYAHSYKNNAARSLDSVTLPNNLIYKPQTDANGGNIGKLLTDLNGGSKFGEYINYRKVGDHTTDMVSSIRYGEVKNGQYVIGGGLNYKYDVRGNISEIWENGKIAVAYTYDKLKRLVREDNMSKGKSWFYSYDNNGNILSKKEADYTRNPVDEITKYNYEKLYSYDGDKLTDCGGESFVYDGFGNPVTYRNKPLTWQKCKLVDFNGVTFAYDGYGLRVKKGDVEYTYDINKKLLRQSDGTDTLEFIYDESGLSGVKCGDTQYVYRKNIQGDITHIFDINGELVACYKYDAWGNHTVVDSEGKPITSKKNIGNLNPFRYRGYLYDTETNLYFLCNRYYDPEVGRFISQDEVSYLDPNTINGLNLYAYCGNNCVMRVDDTGCGWKSFWKKVGNFFKKVGLAIAGVVIAAVGAVLTVAGAALSLLMLPFSFIPGVATISNALSGFITQVGFSTMMYGGFMLASSWDKQIYKDMCAIGWNPFNSNAETAVESGRKVSFYKGMPVVHNAGVNGRSFSFGAIWLDKSDAGDVNTLKHEWGHTVQQMLMGPALYGLMVGIPSAAKWGPWSYYDKPWETMADMFGGVTRQHEEGAESRGKGYTAVSILFGPFAYFFLA